MAILDDTTNLIRLYLHHVGTSEVPDEYHLWAVLSTIAAAVGDRVWYKKFADTKLIPNLYVLLLGPSGTGKGTAIDISTKFVKDLSRVNAYRGKATAPYLIDYLSAIKKKQNGKVVLEDAKLYLVTPELSMSVGSGPFADQFVKLMTELFTGGDYLFQEGTRTRGGVDFKNPVINWIGGTTKEWLMQSVTRDAVEGGFFARVVAVNAEYDPNVRITRPVYPDDRDEVAVEIARRIKELTFITGEITMNGLAMKVDEQWYTGRQAPSDEAMLPTWKRQHDLVLKLAMVMSLADDVDLIVKADHVKRAQMLVREVSKSLPQLIEYASATREMEGIALVRRTIKRFGTIPRYMLMQKVGSRGLTRDRLDAIIETLIQSREVLRMPSNSGAGVVYEWNLPKRTLGDGGGGSGI